MLCTTVTEGRERQERERHEYTTANNGTMRCQTLCTISKEGRKRQERERREYTTTANNGLIRCQTFCTKQREGRERQRSPVSSRTPYLRAKEAVFSVFGMSKGLLHTVDVCLARIILFEIYKATCQLFGRENRRL